MYKIAFEKSAEKEFLKLETKTKEQIAKKIIDLQDGRFENDKALQGKHRGKFRKRAGDYRIIYLREDNLIVITIVRIAHRREVYT